MTPRKTNAARTPPNTKWCWKGQHFTPLSEFPPCAGEWDGLRRICRPCQTAYRRELYLRKQAKAKA